MKNHRHEMSCAYNQLMRPPTDGGGEGGGGGGGGGGVSGGRGGGGELGVSWGLFFSMVCVCRGCG